jgi:DNA-binding transcriptional regulator WhiA
MLNAEGQEYIRQNYHKETYTSIGKKLNIDRHSVGSWVKKLNLSKTFNRKKYYINDNYFNNIGPNQAYVLGFIMSDGYVNSNGLEFTLAVKDIQILEDISKSMESNYPIKVTYGSGKNKNKQYCRSRFKSKIIYDNLVAMGYKRHKTGNEFLPEIEEDMFPHFVRGMFDGDGYISFGNYQNYYIRHTFGLCCSNRTFLETICEKTGLGQVYTAENNFYNWYIQDRLGIYDIYNFLYKEADIKLNRKFDKFNELFSILNNHEDNPQRKRASRYKEAECKKIM